jgi:hypothetical protein
VLQRPRLLRRQEREARRRRPGAAAPMGASIGVEAAAEFVAPRRGFRRRQRHVHPRRRSSSPPLTSHMPIDTSTSSWPRKQRPERRRPWRVRVRVRVWVLHRTCSERSSSRRRCSWSLPLPQLVPAAGLRREGQGAQAGAAWAHGGGRAQRRRRQEAVSSGTAGVANSDEDARPTR